ncbi:hypothetical protein JVT61DRAFT_3920 [Boletus reticuloceps]|uniref:Uncharacterized protein n=1 Tax=Boletus reticuloceps TaxID=495285 RepID=A0A8I2YMY9_9AGAM|nr:hypothetical protein JVT61DRAFT_3920 [Boletus reticuloceps]
MDPNLANSILANIDSRIYEILQTYIPSNSFEAWTQVQEQVEGQLAIASTVVESATDVPDLVIATKMFWRSKDEGWPDWKQIIGCPVEVLETHLWYRSTNPLPSTNTTHNVLSSNNDPAPPSDIANVHDAQPGWTSVNVVNEHDEAPIVATKGKGKQREYSVSSPKQDVPYFPSETHHFEQTSAAPSQSGSLALLCDAEDEDTTMGEIASEEEDELEEEPEHGHSTTCGTSTAN